MQYLKSWCTKVVAALLFVMHASGFGIRSARSGLCQDETMMEGACTQVAILEGTSGVVRWEAGDQRDRRELQVEDRANEVDFKIRA